MRLRKPLLPGCLLHWTEPSNARTDEVLRLVSWRRNLTLQGSSFSEFVDQVFPLLDGTLSIDEICQEVAHTFHEEDVTASLEMLASQGIIVEGDDGLSKYARPDLLAQLGWLAETAPDGRAAMKQFANAHVVLFGAGSHGAVAARALVTASIGKITIVDPAYVGPTDMYFSGLFGPDDLGRNRADTLANVLSKNKNDTMIESHSSRPTDQDAIKSLIEGASFVLCCLESGELGLALELNLACRASKVNWIAASLEGTVLVIGPGFFHTMDGPCYMCWRLREIAGAKNPQTRAALEKYLVATQKDFSDRRENLAASADIVGGLLSTEVLTCLSETSAPNLDGRFLQLELLGLRMEKHRVLRKPDCPVCNSELGTPT